MSDEKKRDKTTREPPERTPYPEPRPARERPQPRRRDIEPAQVDPDVPWDHGEEVEPEPADR